MRDSNDIDLVTPDPAPCYATAEEIALAERLRRKIEERYLQNENGARSDAFRPAAGGLGKVRRPRSSLRKRAQQGPLRLGSCLGSRRKSSTRSRRSSSRSDS